ncbi:MAG: hypothetical protein SGBAC_013129 [Bacillariaceae sp.]
MTATGGSGSVYAEASTVRVVNSEERMALSQSQQEQEEEEYDLKHHPLACMDNACHAMVGLFGAGSDKQDEDLESTVGTHYTNMVACVTPTQKEDANATEQQQQEQLSKELPLEQAPPPAVTETQQPAPSVTPETKRTFSFVTPKKSNTKNSKKSNSNNNKQLRVAPTGVTVDDDQIEARRKNRLGKWWKKTFQKDASQRSKSVPPRRRQQKQQQQQRRRRRQTQQSGTDTVPSSPSTVADYIDMSNVYNEPLPNHSNEDNQSAASFTPRTGDSDSEEEEDLSSLNVWKELNDMWEESGHDMVRVISDNLSVKDGGGGSAAAAVAAARNSATTTEQDVLTKYEQTVAAEQLLEAQRKEKNEPLEVSV